MARETYVIRDGKAVPKHLAAPLRSRGPRSGLAIPMIISDTLRDPVKSMADGRIYDSKSAYYKSVKSAGCEIVGNDPAGYTPREIYDEKAHEAEIVADVKRAIQEESTK